MDAEASAIQALLESVIELAGETLAGAEGHEVRARLAALGLGLHALQALRVGLHPGKGLLGRRLSRGLHSLADETGLLSAGLTGRVLYPAHDEAGRPWTIYASGVGPDARTLALRGAALPPLPVYLDRALAAGERDLILVREVRDAAALQAQGRPGAVASVLPRLSRSQLQALVRNGIRTVEVRLGPHAGRDAEAECLRALEAVGIAARVGPLELEKPLGAAPLQRRCPVPVPVAPDPLPADAERRAGAAWRVLAEVVEDDGVAPKRYFELSAGHEGDPRLIRVPAAELAGAEWLAGELGRSVPAEERGSVLQSVLMQARQAPRRLAITHLGWTRVGSEWVYLHADGGAGRSGPIAGVEVRAGPDLQRFRLPTAPGLEELRRSVRASLTFLDLAPGVVTIPLYAAIWRAALGEVGSWTLRIVGDHARELATLAQQHWGPRASERGGVPSCDRAFRAKDCLILADGSEGAAERSRALVVSCGEEARAPGPYLALSLAEREVALERLGPCRAEALAGRFSAALAGFLTWLAGNDLQGRRERLLSAAGAASTDQGTIAAELELALEVFAEFAAESGAVAPPARSSLVARSREAIAAATRPPLPRQPDRDPLRQLLRLLAIAISTGRAHVAGIDGGPPDTSPFSWGWRPGRTGTSWEAQGTRIGWTAGEELYLERRVIVSIANELLDDEDRPSYRALGELFSRSGLLRSFDPDRETFGSRRVLAGERRTVLHVSVDVLQAGADGEASSLDRR